jgi:hypothetical protein
MPDTRNAGLKIAARAVAAALRRRTLRDYRPAIA